MEAIIIVTESNNVVTVRFFTATANPVYDGTAKYKTANHTFKKATYQLIYTITIGICRDCGRKYGGAK